MQINAVFYATTVALPPEIIPASGSKIIVINSYFF